MDDRELAYHAAQARQNPNYYRELDLFNLWMFGLTDEKLQQILSQEIFKEYCIFVEKLNKADNNTQNKNKEN